jgi:E3 ubiquitin-protein ligase CHFR
VVLLPLTDSTKSKPGVHFTVQLGDSASVQKGASQQKRSETTKVARLGKKAIARSATMSEEMKCGICLEIIYQCVTLMPCLHNFCGGCYSTWMKRNTNCPKCRDPVSEVRRNTALNNIIEAFLAGNPGEARD